VRSLGDVARSLLPPGRVFASRGGRSTSHIYASATLLVPHADTLDPIAAFPPGVMVYLGPERRAMVTSGEPQIIQPWQTNVGVLSFDPAVATWTELLAPGDQPVEFANGVEVANGGVCFVASPGLYVDTATEEQPGTTLGSIVDGIADELQRVETLARELGASVLRDLDAWRDALGIDPADTEEGARARIVANLLGQTDATRAAYDAAAASLGLVITRIDSYVPFEAGRSAAGSAVRDDSWLHTFEVYVGSLTGDVVVPGTGSKAHGYVVGWGAGPWTGIDDATILAAAFAVPGPVHFDPVAVVHRYGDAAPVVELRAKQTGAAGNLPWDATVESNAIPNGYSGYRARGSALTFNENDEPVFSADTPFAGGVNDVREPPPDAVAAFQRVVDTSLRRAHTLVRVRPVQAL